MVKQPACRRGREKWGKIANEYVVSLFPVFTMLDAFAVKFKDRINKSCHLFIVIKNNAVTYYTQPSDWRAAHLALIKKSMQYTKLFISN